MAQTGFVAPHVLIVDDDAGVRDLLRDCLEQDGFTVSEAADSVAMQAHLSKQNIDLVTLDLALGGENGLALATQIRASKAIPIVIITGKGNMVDRVIGLELGADDYIAKPFHPREVVARVRAVLRRVPDRSMAAPTGGHLAFGNWMLDLGRRELSAMPHAVRELTTAEFNLLEVFARRPRRVLSRDTIMDLLKGHDWTPLDRSIDALISRLRRKIETDPTKPELIKTVRGTGYVFACEVRSW